MKYSIVILVVFVILQILDIITTIRALKVPGVSEGKVWTHWFMDTVGVMPALLILFVINTVAMCAGLYLAHVYGSYSYVEYIVQGMMIIVCLTRIYAVYTNVRNMEG